MTPSAFYQGASMKCTANTKLGALSLVLALLAGSAAGQQNSGFLTDYSKLAPAADNPKVSLWISKDFDFKPYHKVMLDPVEVWVSPTSEYKGASPDALKGIADRFTSSFKRALQPGYQLVNKPGPGVLHIRLAVTGLNLAKPAFKPRNIVPIVFALRAVSGAINAQDVVLTAEMEVRGPDDKVVAEALATGAGDWTVKPDYDVTWQDVQGITDSWAKGLRRQLDQARGVAPQSRARG
jgi:hypothetical protein